MNVNTLTCDSDIGSALVQNGSNEEKESEN